VRRDGQRVGVGAHVQEVGAGGVQGVCGSGDVSALVDHSAEDSVSVDLTVERDDDGGVVVGRALLAALVWPVIVEVSGVLVHDRDGVAFVIDQDPVSALWPDAADEPFG
jgi:hypothetical protein